MYLGTPSLGNKCLILNKTIFNPTKKIACIFIFSIQFQSKSNYNSNSCTNIPFEYIQFEFWNYNNNILTMMDSIWKLLDYNDGKPAHITMSNILLLLTRCYFNFILQYSFRTIFRGTKNSCKVELCNFSRKQYFNCYILRKKGMWIKNNYLYVWTLAESWWKLHGHTTRGARSVCS